MTCFDTPQFKRTTKLYREWKNGIKYNKPEKPAGMNNSVFELGKLQGDFDFLTKQHNDLLIKVKYLEEQLEKCMYNSKEFWRWKDKLTACENKLHVIDNKRDAAYEKIQEIKSQWSD